ncbi:hypothetical protein SLEP1_g38041 [Rubroshorea leprosula]|uniref:Uncharacterized protein n=1 Tax=Rubroshorea leprosula TaxID=152421 RepID=A0AAV5KWU9_9ROSI|nr:hypothetical protein SLEP1_g38041 [Rubroshorea leprosula]
MSISPTRVCFIKCLTHGADAMKYVSTPYPVRRKGGRDWIGLLLLIIAAAAAHYLPLLTATAIVAAHCSVICCCSLLRACWSCCCVVGVAAMQLTAQKLLGVAYCLPLPIACRCSLLAAAHFLPLLTTQSFAAAHCSGGLLELLLLITQALLELLLCC